MDGIHGTEAHLLKAERQCLYGVGDLQIFRGK